MLVFIKLGGSLITDKRVENSFREAMVVRLAQEIRATLTVEPELKILVGHGSGSFGHFAASRFKTVEGVHSQEEWRAFAHVATVAAELNARVARVFDEAHLAVWRIQPSASALAHDSEILQLSTLPIQTALEKNLIPLVYGDVALDEVRGGTIISTEKIFFYLAHHLQVSRILLIGEVEGVYDTEGKVVSEITPANYSQIQSALGGSAGTDVTGGMETKVSDMLKLVQSKPDLSIRILDGTKNDLLKQTLLNESSSGTLIHAGSD
jgi:isopentenyl phosphate kinase